MKASVGFGCVNICRLGRKKDSPVHATDVLKHNTFKRDSLSIRDVSRRGDSSIVEVFILIHPHLCCSPCVPDRRRKKTMNEKGRRHETWAKEREKRKHEDGKG